MLQPSFGLESAKPMPGPGAPDEDEAAEVDDVVIAPPPEPDVVPE
jgi:hypothetical protein